MREDALAAKGLPRGEVMLEDGIVVCDMWNRYTTSLHDRAAKKYDASRAVDSFWEGQVGPLSLLHY
jgi:hypothetical protein